MKLLLQLLTWWNGQTLGTMLFTRRHGQKVGEDDAGNTYYQSKDGKKRWVIYANEVEASQVPVEWHGWLHHSFDNNPAHDPLPKKSWEKPHQPNLTGTAMAYVPSGSMFSDKPVKRDDYESWDPGT